MSLPSVQSITAQRAAVFILVLAVAAIAGAWIFQLNGFLPCELCLDERWFYYVGIPLAAAVVAIAGSGPKALVVPGILLLALLFAGSAAFGVYHAGVEWHFWQGPTECTGPIHSGTFDAFQQQLRTGQVDQVVRCDVVQLRILGLSLAGWNAVLSAVMCAVALIGARNSARAK